MYIVFGQLDDDLLAMGAAPASASLSVRVGGLIPQKVFFKRSRRLRA